MLALESIKVLDLSQYAPGFFCTMILADQGAEVIAIEPSTEGRVSSGRWGKSGSAEQRVKEAAMDTLNRNKKSLTLNLKAPQGQEIFHRLVRSADVVVESFRPRVVTRLGIGYEAVKRINPQIIYCSLTGFGQTGPYRDLPGHDINYISFAGVLGLIGNEDRPALPLNLIGDFAGAGLHGAIGILLALVARNKTGEGQYIDIAFTDAAAHLMVYFAQLASIGKSFKRGQGRLAGIYPYYRVYQTKDGGYISVGCLEPAFWKNLCQALGKPEYTPYGNEPLNHFSQKPAGEKWAEITAEFERIFLTRTRDEWFRFLSEKDVPIAKVYDSMEEVAADPQLVHREMFLEIDHPVAGTVRQVGIPFKLSQTPGRIRRLAPFPGQDNDEILADLGYSRSAVSKFREAGVLGENETFIPDSR